ncbi:hypothetical protein KFE25_012737 [Diacronema lutheri]|uniref:AB hydrolase-1 domain-containing protein n=1 Tax=Diacronema lutheri TaxID=2081491 RepID=A0A8J6C0P4_DIALT|nr:hypothetical protein KFE25_012737 [Diacronema lutheri]
MLARRLRVTTGARAVSTLARLPGLDGELAVESMVYSNAGARAPWVVCFHSSGLGARQWAAGPQLAPGANWIAVNFCGYAGSSPWPREQRAPSLADQASLACAAIDHVVPDRARLFVLGHSYGGSIALASCARLAATRDVAALVLFEPNCFFLLPHEQRAAFADEVRGWLELARAGDEGGFMSRFYAFWFGAGAWEVMPSRTRAKLRETLRDLDLELVATLAEMESADGAVLSSAAINGALRACRKHAMCGTLGTHALTLQLLERLRTHAGFELHETSALGAGHLAPFTHAGVVLREMLTLAGAPLAPEDATGV